MLHPSSSLAFRSLLKSAAVRAGFVHLRQNLSGSTPAATAFYVAAAAAETRIFLVVPTDADVEQMTSDARFFLGSLQGWGELEVAQRVLPFPSPEVDPFRGLSPHFDVASARGRALYALAMGSARLVIASARALVPRVSAPARMAAAGVTLRPALEIPPRELGARLALAGFAREDPVDQHGEFCIRGGVVDVYPAAEAQPVRLEFIGDIIESIRRYDAATQRSLTALDQIVISPQRDILFDLARGTPDASAALDRSSTLAHYLALANAALVVFEIDEVGVRGRQLEAQWRASAAEMASRGRLPVSLESMATPWDEIDAWLSRGHRVSQLALDDGSTGALATHTRCQPVLEYHGRIGDWVGEIRRARSDGSTVVFVAATAGRAERTAEILKDYDIRARGLDETEDLSTAAVVIATGQLSKGFRLPDAALELYAETDLFEEERRVHERRRSAARSFMADFRDLKIDDLVVHVDNGIGRFVGLKRIAIGVGDEREFMELRYADDDKLFVPIERLDLVQRYTGGAAPALDRLGGTTWEKAKTRVRKAMRDMAEELLKLYAARKAVEGHAFSPDTHWQQEFNDAFAYDLTADQQAAIAQITRDMEASTPMDRLLCGDVGYGKTEVAMRAAFKAVMDGKQVAVLAPTTVLAFQHLRTLTERFAGFPVKMDMLSRFRSPQEQKETLAALAAGQVDIVVGTHRLLSKDVVFRDLGLLVVDEEQRFGVAHKERIKQMRRRVDVLTMTATPIPRTLNMSLVGIRDMSVIETPPRDRLSIQTHVVKFDQEVIQRAIRTELERQGQVYVVHNRVESIYSIAELMQRLVPEAKLTVAHGQMSSEELERVMMGFVSRQYDVLVSTTIIENGLDIANANTMIVNRADRYGLAQLYQLRGRVGRADRRAYAYLLVPPEEALSPVAKRRLAAIREFSDLGSGFRIAALDLEIRGAGNLLGGEQSGHIDAVGFETYMKLLEDTIRELKGEEPDVDRRAAVNLHLDLRIDEDYIPDTNQRLAVYRRIAGARSSEALDQLIEELRDRYGALPPSVLNLWAYAHIRVQADRLGLESVDRQGQAVTFRFRQDTKLDPVWLLKLVQSRNDLKLVPPATVRLDVSLPANTPETPRARSKQPIPATSDASASWWATRAKTGQVAPGFNREAIRQAQASAHTNVDSLLERLRQALDTLSRGLTAG